MIQQIARRPPRSVLAALVILIGAYATVIAHDPWASAATVAASLIGAALAAGAVYGLWRGNPLAQGVVVLAMAGNLMFGLLEYAEIGWWRAANLVAALAVAVLLLVPPSAREWFADPHVDSTPNFGEASDQLVDTEALWEETDGDKRR